MNQALSFEKNAGNKPQKNRKLFFVFLLAFLIIVVVFLWWLFQRKSYGLVTVRTPEATPAADMAPPTKTYRGQFVRFAYSGDYLEKPPLEPKKPVLERVYLSRNDLEGRKISVWVQAIDYPLAEYSSYRIRVDDPKVYTMEKIMKNGLSLTLFTKKTIVYEVGAFFSDRGRAISIVLSSPTRLEGLREELLALLDTFELIEAGGGE